MTPANVLEHVKRTIDIHLEGSRIGSQGAYAISFYDDKQELTRQAESIGLMRVFEAFDDEFYVVTLAGYKAVRSQFSDVDREEIDRLLRYTSRE